MMLTWLQRPKQSKTLESAQTPPGVRIYAVGDIHGRADLLEQLQGQIEQDAARHPDKVRQLIYLGDYVDRGPQSREVLELLSRRRLPGVTSHCLLGNHDQ
ncbi:MAG: metallophosphoesterase, partial [Chromatiaceae bacterium]|nr:metallophosphoesterase [Chromatiaceae bacterium]